ncbi:DDE superfamily endonuclease [Pyrenophora tritici-repentis]|uniref:DDE superfamily endonuclease n=1 Tax=Pyrenophora tritici-repentis TaxID=45151 RepID=A0A922N222_9PLEO|nr:DDE superfamily endonuclease [Pyrenophora tritici-repentis]
MTDKLLDECASNPVGKNWVDNFVKRTPELRTCWSRPYNHRRAACEDLAAIQRWFDLVKSIKERWGIVDDDIYNFGETGFMMGKILSQIVIISSEGYGKKKRIQPGNREWVTVIQGVGASGRRLPPFVVFAGKVLIDVWFQNLPTDWVLEVSPNGRTNNQLALAWLEHFDTHTKSCTVGGY